MTPPTACGDGRRPARWCLTVVLVGCTTKRRGNATRARNHAMAEAIEPTTWPELHQITNEVESLWPGLVERVTFHSAETGFCVLRVKVRGHKDLVTVLGSAAEVHAGESIQASGQWQQHREHGLQFRAGYLGE